MKKNVLILLLLGMLLPVIRLQAQDNPAPLNLTVQQAVDLALEKNRSVASAKYNYDISKKTVWETIASGLPQVNGSASLDDNLKLMTTMLPAEIFGGTPGTYIPVTFGQKFNSSYGVTAATPLFNAPYLVGIQISKLASRLSENQVKQSEADVKESVMTCYYLILVSEETLKVLEGNLKNWNEMLTSTKAMFSVGMAESTDVDQMLSNVATVNNAKLSMERTLEVNYNLLRFLLGVDMTSKVTLTDSLDSIIDSFKVEELLTQDFNIENNLNYQLIDGQVKMSELSLKSAKASTLPSLSGSVYYMKTGQGNKVSNMDWFPYSVAGLQLSVPIFAFGERHSKIQKARLSLMNSENQKQMVSDNLLMQEKQLRYNLISSNEQYRNQKDNIEIAQRVLTSFQNKYKQGMASSLDLTSANSNYLSAETNYLTSLMTLLQNKVAFDKLMNNL
jgi:outer membrane protein